MYGYREIPNFSQYLMRSDFTIVYNENHNRVVAKTDLPCNRLKRVILKDDKGVRQSLLFKHLVLATFFNEPVPYDIAFKNGNSANIVSDNIQIKYINDKLVKVYDTDYYLTSKGEVYKHIFGNYYERCYFTYNRFKVQGKTVHYDCAIKYLVYKLFGEYKDKEFSASDIFHKDGNKENNSIDNLYLSIDLSNECVMKRTADMLETEFSGIYVTEDGRFFVAITDDYVMERKFKARTYKGVALSKIFYKAFYGEIPRGCYVYRRDKNIENYRKDNLYLLKSWQSQPQLVLEEKETGVKHEYTSLVTAYNQLVLNGKYTKSESEFLSELKNGSLADYNIISYSPNHDKHYIDVKVSLFDKKLNKTYTFSTYKKAYWFLCDNYGYTYSYFTFVSQYKSGDFSFGDIE